jgi:hypothetical protein
MNCHGDGHNTSCTVNATGIAALQDNCIDCHMPILPSKKIQLNVGSKQKHEPDNIRTHYIAVYREETRKFINRQP